MSHAYHNTWSNRFKQTKISAFTHVYLEILSGYTWGEGQTAWMFEIAIKLVCVQAWK